MMWRYCSIQLFFLPVANFDEMKHFFFSKVTFLFCWQEEVEETKPSPSKKAKKAWSPFAVSAVLRCNVASLDAPFCALFIL